MTLLVVTYEVRDAREARTLVEALSWDRRFRAYEIPEEDAPTPISVIHTTPGGTDGNAR